MVTTKKEKCVKCGKIKEVLSQNNYCLKCFEALREEIKINLAQFKK